MQKLYDKYRNSIIVVVVLALALVGWGQKIDLEATSIRSSAVLTTSYVATTVRSLDKYNQLTLLVAYTKGSSTQMRLKVEFSEDKSTFFQETSAIVADANVEHTLFYRWMDTTGNYIIRIPNLGTWYKVSVIAITSGTNTLCAITEVKGKV